MRAKEHSPALGDGGSLWAVAEPLSHFYLFQAAAHATSEVSVMCELGLDSDTLL